MPTITITHREHARLVLDYRWTDDRVRRFEVFAPDGYVFMPDGVSSFICIDRKDAIERVQSSSLEPVDAE